MTTPTGKLRLLTVGACALVVLIVGGVSLAAIPDAGGVIHGCRNKQTGALKVIDSGDECPSGQVALNWNQQGQPGPKGDAGLAGRDGVGGSGLGSFDDVIGMACNTGNHDLAGTMQVGYGGYPDFPVYLECHPVKKRIAVHAQQTHLTYFDPETGLVAQSIRGSGSVTVMPHGVTIPVGATEAVWAAVGEQVSYQAIPDPGSTFTWANSTSCAGQTGDTCTFTVTGDVTDTITFDQP